MFSNVALNAFCQSIIDQSSVVDEIGVPSIDENDIEEKHKIKRRRRKRA
jgi:CRISPR/Cas system-associated protein Cas7 (RAMP superfamily)